MSRQRGIAHCSGGGRSNDSGPALPASALLAKNCNEEACTDEEVAQAHLEFYARHPRVVEVGLDKKGARLAALGWRP